MTLLSNNNEEPAIAAMHGLHSLVDSVIRSETSLITESDRSGPIR